MIEQFINNGISTLVADINSSVTSLSVNSPSKYPTVGQFRILIDNEILLVTGVAGAVFTVIRAVEGTSAAVHSAGQNVLQILTKAAWEKYRADNVIKDSIINRPDAGREGALFLTSDSLNLSRDNGTNFDVYGPLNKLIPYNSTLFQTYNPQPIDQLYVDSHITRFVRNGSVGVPRGGYFRNTQILTSNPIFGFSFNYNPANVLRIGAILHYADNAIFDWAFELVRHSDDSPPDQAIYLEVNVYNSQVRVNTLYKKPLSYFTLGSLIFMKMSYTTQFITFDISTNMLDWIRLYTQFGNVGDMRPGFWMYGGDMNLTIHHYSE